MAKKMSKSKKIAAALSWAEQDRRVEEIGAATALQTLAYRVVRLNEKVRDLEVELDVARRPQAQP